MKQPVEIQTLYAELLERLTAREAQRAIGQAPGSFVVKTVKGAEYYYFQFLEPGGVKRQAYLGRRTGELDSLAARHAEGRRASEADDAGIERLCALLRAGGALRTDAPSVRVIRALSDSGVFRRGGVLVGTHAFVVLGNVLGSAWAGSGMRTQDVDIAAQLNVDVAVPGSAPDVPSILEGLEMGFLPVPALDPRGHATSFKVRGQGLRVDLLTPAQRASSKDVRIGWLGSWAQPLRFLDYLVEQPVRAAVIAGESALVNVPDPARFALHKLIVAGERPASDHAKRDKDMWQAGQLLEVLLSERRGDVLLAWDALVERGTSWTKRVLLGASALQDRFPEVSRTFLHIAGGTPK